MKYIFFLYIVRKILNIIDIYNSKKRIFFDQVA